LAPNRQKLRSRPSSDSATRLCGAVRKRSSTALRRSSATWQRPAGNLLQRTRCMYFRDTAMPCNKARARKRAGPAITGSNRTLAVLGASEHCIATNPSDMCVAMVALEATIHIQGSKGTRAIPIGDFHLLPGSTPQRETVLEPGDLITHVTLPPLRSGSKQVYLKLRDRASYEFALGVGRRCAHIKGGNCDSGARRTGGCGGRSPGGLPRPSPLSSVSPRTKRTFERPRRQPCATPNPRARTHSKSSWLSAA